MTLVATRGECVATPFRARRQRVERERERAREGGEREGGGFAAKGKSKEYMLIGASDDMPPVLQGGA